MNKVLIASPVCKKYDILKNFLETINQQNHNDFTIDYFFIDDNQEEASSKALHDFAEMNRNTVLLKAEEKKFKYEDGNNTHNWNEYLVWRLAELKNFIIEYAKKENYDYLFFVDSDLILNPNTIQYLMSLNLDIVSEIFWTKWTPEQMELPQVWLYDHYELVPKQRLEQLTNTEAQARFFSFINQLKKAGVYEVGGLGACTLISKNALNKGVSFSEIKNISFWGEDRHFCIRASALGIKLYVDTTYPALHIYRDEDLNKISLFKATNQLK